MGALAAARQPAAGEPCCEAGTHNVLPCVSFELEEVPIARSRARRLPGAARERMMEMIGAIER